MSSRELIFGLLLILFSNFILINSEDCRICGCPTEWSCNPSTGNCHNFTDWNEIHLYPSDSNNFEYYAERLNPGDMLIVHEGTYSHSSRLGISVEGTYDKPVVIKGADGEDRPVITTTANQNTINIAEASFLTIKHLEITGTNDAIKMYSSGNAPNYVTIEDNVIHDINVGINWQSDAHHFFVRSNEIYNTGGTGEAMYVGCNNAGCIVSNSYFVNNHIHHSGSSVSQGDGIEIKVGSHSNIVRNNVIHDMKFPGIFVYGTNDNGERNIVEGNVIWNCLEGIYAVADAIVRNNIIIGCDYGLSLYPHAQVSSFKDVTAVHNTLYNNDRCLQIRWGSTNNMVLANNAIYCSQTTAINSNGAINADIVKNNYVEGTSSVQIDDDAFFDGGSAIDQFENPDSNDFWLKVNSILKNKGLKGLAELDFNENERDGNTESDIGAYHTTGFTNNPGFSIKADFKGLSKQCGYEDNNSNPNNSLLTAIAIALGITGVIIALVSLTIVVLVVLFLTFGLGLLTNKKESPKNSLKLKEKSKKQKKKKQKKKKQKKKIGKK